MIEQDYLNVDLVQKSVSKGFDISWVKGVYIPTDIIVKWLREVHQMHIEISIIAVKADGTSYPQPFYRYEVCNTKDGRYLLDTTNDGDSPNYRITREKAIEYCLTKIN